MRGMARQLAEYVGAIHHLMNTVDRCDPIIKNHRDVWLIILSRLGRHSLSLRRFRSFLVFGGGGLGSFLPLLEPADQSQNDPD